MPQIIDRLADDYESVTVPVESVPGVRVLVAAGFLLPHIAVYTLLVADGAVEAIYLDIDD